MVNERERGKHLRSSWFAPSRLHVPFAAIDLRLFQSAWRSGIGGQAEKEEGYGQQVELIHLSRKRVVMWDGGESSKLKVGIRLRDGGRWE